MNVAYLRVSTEKQQIDNQKDEIVRFAYKMNMQIDLWHYETASGNIIKSNRLLDSVLNNLKPNDTIVVSEISRLSRRMLEIMSILNLCIERKVTIYSIKEGFCFCDDFNSKIMGFAFGMSAEIERSLISARTKEALAYKKSQGIVLGRPKGASMKMQILIQNKMIIKEMIDNKVPITELARQYKVSRGTLYKFLKTID